MPTIAELREGIDSLDADLIARIQQRIAVSREIQTLRVAEGGSRLVHEREAIVVGRWQAVLGEQGGRIASALLELCRGVTTAPADDRAVDQRTRSIQRTEV